MTYLCLESVESGGMCTKCFIYLFLVAVSLLFSCDRTNTQGIFSEAERLLKSSQYDSATTLLEHEVIPSELTDSDKARYGMLITWAHDGQGRSLVNDSIIEYTLEHYKTDMSDPIVFSFKQNSYVSDRLIYSYLLKAFYQKHRGEIYEVRSALLREALDSANVRSETFLLSDLYNTWVDAAFSLSLYRQSVAVAKEWESLGNESVDLARYMAGLSYDRLGMRDSSLYYLAMAADSSYIKQKRYAYHFARNYADVLSSIDPRMTLEYLRLMEKRFPGETHLNSYVPVWLSLGQLDSAKLYLKQYSSIIFQDSCRSNVAGHLLYYAYQLILDSKENKIINASPLGQYGDSLMFVSDGMIQLEKERMLTQNRLEQANLRLEISRQRTFLVLMTVLLAMVLISGVVAFYIRNRRNRLVEVEERLEALRQLLEESNPSGSVNEQDRPDSAFFRKVLLQQLGIIRLVATTPTQQNKELLKQMTRITNEDIPVDTLLVWEDLYPIIDGVYDNFHTRMIRQAEGRLVEKEMQLCCLLRAGFSTKEISVVTQQSVRTIYQRKTDIRHKLGMEEKEDIVEWFT